MSRDWYTRYSPQTFLGCTDKVLWSPLKHLNIGKHGFKSCEETASDPNQDNITFPGNKQENKVYYCKNTALFKLVEDARNCTILANAVNMPLLKTL